jgi:hypothetical protein
VKDRGVFNRPDFLILFSFGPGRPLRQWCGPLDADVTSPTAVRAVKIFSSPENGLQTKISASRSGAAESGEARTRSLPPGVDSGCSLRRRRKGSVVVGSPNVRLLDDIDLADGDLLIGRPGARC